MRCGLDLGRGAGENRGHLGDRARFQRKWGLVRATKPRFKGVGLGPARAPSFKKNRVTRLPEPIFNESRGSPSRRTASSTKFGARPVAERQLQRKSGLAQSPNGNFNEIRGSPSRPTPTSTKFGARPVAQRQLQRKSALTQPPNANFNEIRASSEQRQVFFRDQGLGTGPRAHDQENGRLMAGRHPGGTSPTA